jgi:hypothetical protein
MYMVTDRRYRSLAVLADEEARAESWPRTEPSRVDEVRELRE